MIRKIIHIDEEKCTGCGLCAKACHEGAIDIIDGKARLVREHFCDGFGDCLPACPADAISFEEREAPAYDEAAVLAAKEAAAHRCPGAAVTSPDSGAEELPAFRLRNWPVQIKLAPVTAQYFAGAELVIAADCTLFACAGVRPLLAGRTVLIGCPKLDAVDYSAKLADILRCNDIAGVTVVRMEVPCCGGLEMAVRRAMAAAGRTTGCRVVTVGIGGTILGDA